MKFYKVNAQFDSTISFYKALIVRKHLLVRVKGMKNHYLDILDDNLNTNISDHHHYIFDPNELVEVKNPLDGLTNHERKKVFEYLMQI